MKGYLIKLKKNLRNSPGSIKSYIEELGNDVMPIEYSGGKNYKPAEKFYAKHFFLIDRSLEEIRRVVDKEMLYCGKCGPVYGPQGNKWCKHEIPEKMEVNS